MPDDELLSTPEAAELAGVALSTIYRWIQGGVLSYRYFEDGRKAVVKSEILAIAQSGENDALRRLFKQVAVNLAQAVALLPAVEQMFGNGWEGHAWPTDYWSEVHLRAVQQSEAHLDIGPFIRRRGRPRHIPDSLGVPVDSVWRAIEAFKQTHPGAVAVSGRDIVLTLAPFLKTASGNHREIITPQVLGILQDLVNEDRLTGTVDLGDAMATSIQF